MHLYRRVPRRIHNATHASLPIARHSCVTLACICSGSAHAAPGLLMETLPWRRPSFADPLLTLGCASTQRQPPGQPWTRTRLSEAHCNQPHPLGMRWRKGNLP